MTKTNGISHSSLRYGLPIVVSIAILTLGAYYFIVYLDAGLSESWKAVEIYSGRVTMRHYWLGYPIQETTEASRFASYSDYSVSTREVWIAPTDDIHMLMWGLSSLTSSRAENLSLANSLGIANPSGAPLEVASKRELVSRVLALIEQGQTELAGRMLMETYRRMLGTKNRLGPEDLPDGGDPSLNAPSRINWRDYFTCG